MVSVKNHILMYETQLHLLWSTCHPQMYQLALKSREKEPETFAQSPATITVAEMTNEVLYQGSAAERLRKHSNAAVCCGSYSFLAPIGRHKTCVYLSELYKLSSSVLGVLASLE